MTKKELLEDESFKALPDDAEIVFNNNEDRRMCVPLIPQHFWYEKRCMNIEYIQNAPDNIRDNIKPKYKCFFVIDGMPFDYMKHKLNMTFDL